VWSVERTDRLETGGAVSRRGIVLVVLVVGLVAVVEARTSGRWDAATASLTHLASVTYDETSAYELTLRTIDGVWKVIDVHGWMDYTRGVGIHLGGA